LGLTKNVKDTLNLFKGFRYYLQQIVKDAENAKKEISSEFEKIAGGMEPSKAIATLTTLKGSPTVSQGPMASALRVQATRWHTAIADIEMLFNIFSKVIRILKSIAELDPGASIGSKAQSTRGKTMQEFKGDETSFDFKPEQDVEQATSMINYLDSVSELSKEAIEMIDIFELAIEKGGTQMNPSKMNKSKVGKMNESRNRITIKLRS